MSDDNPTLRQEALPEIPGYRVVGRAGRGGMGAVYRAQQISTNRTVALKLLGRPGEARQADLAQFWYAVEDDLGVKKIFTQSHEPAFEKDYPRFLEHLGYAPDPEFERWWSKPGGVIYGL